MTIFRVCRLVLLIHGSQTATLITTLDRIKAFEHCIPHPFLSLNHQQNSY